MTFDDYSSSPLSFEEEKYVSKLAYPYLLFLQIRNIMDAINAGDDGKEELENLKAVLKPSWREEIDAKMKEHEKKMEKEIERIKSEYEARLRDVEKLDEVGLLLIEEQTVLRGGGMIT